MTHLERRIVDTPGRLDIFLSSTEVSVSRIRARELIRAGAVLVNGRVARKCAMIVQQGDTVEFSVQALPVTESRVQAVDLQLEVLYEDAACLVIRKPAGIAVHPGVGLPKDEPTILHGIVHLFAERSLPFASSSVLVHRLDKDTTGCLIIAKSQQAHAQIQEQFAARTVRKLYLALVDGCPDPPAALIDASIGRSTTDRTRMAVMRASRTRDARTTYRTLATGDDHRVALLSCELHTGRTHQIRVHLQSIHHPILGDSSYGTEHSIQLSDALQIESICLHAWKISFVSPATNETVTCSARLPDSFVHALHAAKLSEQDY